MLTGRFCQALRGRAMSLHAVASQLLLFAASCLLYSMIQYHYCVQFQPLMAIVHPSDFF